MTLAEIRERYGVPAEVGMRVRWGKVAEQRQEVPDQVVGASSFHPGRLVIYCHYDNARTTAEELTYYNADGEVIWRPE